MFQTSFRFPGLRRVSSRGQWLTGNSSRTTPRSGTSVAAKLRMRAAVLPKTQASARERTSLLQRSPQSPRHLPTSTP